MTASACMAVLSGRSLFLRARLPAAGLDAGATGRASSASLGASGSVALFALVLSAVSSVGSLASSDEPAVPSSLMRSSIGSSTRVLMIFASSRLPHSAISALNTVRPTFVGYAVAFVLNRKITFHADANPFVSTILYIIMVIFTIWAKGIIGPWLSSFTNSFLPVALAPTVATLLGMAVPMIWTYPCNRFIIHRKKKAPAVEEKNEDK